MTIISEMKSLFESILSDADFGAAETFTVKKLSLTYSTDGTPAKTYSGSTTFIGDFQAISGDTIKKEMGLEIKSTHKIIAYNSDVTLALNSTGQDLIVKTGDEAGNYLVNYVNKFNTHCEVLLIKVIGELNGTVS